MNRFVLGGFAGALLGVAVSVFLPCCNKKFFKKAKRAKNRAFKKLANCIYEII